MVLSHFSCVWFCDSIDVALWALLSIGLSRQEYWSGLTCPLPGELPHPGSEPAPPASPALQMDSLLLSRHGHIPNTWWSSRIFVSTCGSAGQESHLQCRKHGFDSWIRKMPWRRARSPPQYSCWRIAMDRGAWWATVRGVAKDSDTTECPTHSRMVNNNKFKRNERIRSYSSQEACENKIHRYRWMLE